MEDVQDGGEILVAMGHQEEAYGWHRSPRSLSQSCQCSRISTSRATPKKCTIVEMKPPIIGTRIVGRRLLADLRSVLTCLGPQDDAQAFRRLPAFSPGDKLMLTFWPLHMHEAIESRQTNRRPDQINDGVSCLRARLDQCGNHCRGSDYPNLKRAFFTETR